DRLGNQVLLDEFGIFGDVGRLFRDGGGGEIRFDLFEVAFNGDNMSLQKAGDIVGNRLIDSAEGRIGRFRHGKDAVKVFQIGAGYVAIFRHYRFTFGLAVALRPSGGPTLRELKTRPLSSQISETNLSANVNQLPQVCSCR